MNRTHSNSRKFACGNSLSVSARHLGSALNVKVARTATTGGRSGSRGRAISHMGRAHTEIAVDQLSCLLTFIFINAPEGCHGGADKAHTQMGRPTYVTRHLLESTHTNTHKHITNTQRGPTSDMRQRTVQYGAGSRRGGAPRLFCAPTSAGDCPATSMISDGRGCCVRCRDLYTSM